MRAWTSTVLLGLAGFGLSGCAGELSSAPASQRALTQASSSGSSEPSSTNTGAPSGSPSTNPTNTSGSSTSKGQTAEKSKATDIVTSLYKLILGRSPDPAGLDFFVSQLLNGRSIDDVRNDILNSPEAKIRALYVTHLLREPEKAGLDFWINALLSGKSLAEIKKAFQLVEECKVDCLIDTVRTSTKFVTGLYVNLLNRKPEQAGLDFWVDRAQKPGGCAAVAIGIANSQEAINIDLNSRPTRQLVADLYKSILDRSPESTAVVDFWAGVIVGSGRNATVELFAQSAEFKARCKKLGLAE